MSTDAAIRPPGTPPPPCPAIEERPAPVSGGFRRALRRPRLRRQGVAYALSAIAQTFGTVAATAAVYDDTRSAAWVGAVAASRLLPYVLVSPLAGVLADRAGFRRVMVVSAAVRGALCLALAGVLVGPADPLAVVALLFLLTAAGTPCYPAMAAAVSEEVPSADLAPANALLTGVETLAFVAGPALGGFALLATSPTGVLAANAALFAAVLLVATLGPRPVIDLRAAASVDDEDRAWWSGARAVRLAPAAHVPMLLVVAVNLLYGTAVVGIVLVGDQLTAGSHRGLGLLNGALGIGGVVGLVAAGALDRAARPLRLLALLTALTGGSLVLLAVMPWLSAAVVLLAITGAGAVLAEVLALTAIQRAVPLQEVARVFGILDALLVGAICLGSLMTPPLVRVVGLAPALALMGLAIPLAGLAIAVVMRPALRRTSVTLAPAHA